MLERLVILGGTSDVVGRLVVPALVDLEADGALPEAFRIVAVARHDEDDDSYRQHLRDELAELAPEVDADALEALLARTHYHEADSTEADALADAFDDAAAAVYLALPPAVFSPTLEALEEVVLPEGSRVVIEKPFGEDLEHARELNRELQGLLPEDAVHRMDHFLGLQMVQNLLALRFANRLFEPLWHADHVDGVDIVWDETLTLEGRAGFYDGTGALKDMLQNHLLQVLALVAMDMPASLDPPAFRDAKVDLLRQVRGMDVEEAAEHSRRARYTAGQVDGQDVPAYVDEDGVDPELETETYAEVVLAIDSDRWAGVPFRLRTGKALGRDRQEVVVRLRAPDRSPFGDAEVAPNEIRIALEPERIGLRFNVRASGDAFDLDGVEVSRDLAAADVAAYGRVLRDVLEGDPTLSIRGDEAELAWEIMTSVLAAFDQGLVPMESYPAGSAGPAGDDPDDEPDDDEPDDEGSA
jgi:glucose-6-phosphate 1-dehydrogenase